jgi:hypothetical protein
MLLISIVHHSEDIIQFFYNQRDTPIKTGKEILPVHAAGIIVNKPGQFKTAGGENLKGSRRGTICNDF